MFIQKITNREMKHESGPISANIPILLTWVTVATTCSFNTGRKTVAVNLMVNWAKPDPGMILPGLMLFIDTTEMINPYLWNCKCYRVGLKITKFSKKCFT